MALKSTKEMTWNLHKNNQSEDGRKREKGHKEQIEQIENEQQDDRLESNHINNYIEHKWPKHPS